MDAEVLTWTVVFFGGDLLIVIGLMTWAFRKDKEKARLEAANGVPDDE